MFIKSTPSAKEIRIEFPEGPRNEPWGGWAMFKDSEGNVQWTALISTRKRPQQVWSDFRADLVRS